MLLLLQEAAEQAAGITPEDPSIADRIKDTVFAWGPNAIWALAVFVIGRWIAKLLIKTLRKVMKTRSVDPTLTGFLCKTVYAILLTLVVISAMQRLGVNTTSFVAVLGAATLAVGFALQKSLGNLASGVMLMIFRPFRVGDYVEAGGTSGIVEDLGVFASTLRTPDNKKVIVPNGDITGGSITNYSAKETRRVDLVFGIGYGDDVKHAKEVLLGILKADERVLEDPAPVVAVSQLGDSSVNFVVRPWVKRDDYWKVYWDVTEQVKLEFDARGISIPFPQRDVHLHQAG